MAFKPNYGRDRAERDRAARARTEEKQKKKEEKLAQRKAERDAAQALRRMRASPTERPDIRVPPPGNPARAASVADPSGRAELPGFIG